jgi:hypothetical protein
MRWEIITKDDEMRIWKEAVVAYFTVINWTD